MSTTSRITSGELSNQPNGSSGLQRRGMPTGLQPADYRPVHLD